MTDKEILIQQKVRPLYNELAKEQRNKFVQDFISDQIASTNQHLQENLNDLTLEQSNEFLQRISVYTQISSVIDKICSFSGPFDAVFEMKELDFQKRLYVARHFNDQLTDRYSAICEADFYTEGEDISENDFFMTILLPCFFITIMLDEHKVESIQNSPEFQANFK